MDMLYTAKEVLTQLKKNGVVTFSKVAFSQHVTAGVIPHRREDGVKSKLYHYGDVEKAIIKAGIGKPKDILDPLKKLPSKTTESDEEYLEEIKLNFHEGMSLTDANIIKTVVMAKREQIKLAEEEGNLVSREEMENTAYTVARVIRDKLMTTPERLSNELANMDDPHQIKELLYKEFNTILLGFSEESFGI